MTVAAALFPANAIGEEGSWSLGIRGGLSARVYRATLYDFEVFGSYRLPWRAESRSGWVIGAGWDGSAGVLTAGDQYGFIGTLGPTALLGKRGFPLQVDLGVSAAVLSGDTFWGRNYNGLFQFISHGGFVYRFSPSLAFAYRIQHMSNAGFNGSHNPGANMHLFGFQWYPGGTP